MTHTTRAACALAVALLMTGCGSHMTNEQIIAETKKCREAGMRAEALIDMTNRVAFIQCLPKEEPSR